MPAGRISEIAARAGTFIVLALVLMRAIVPGGFMPALDPNSGKIAVIMCSATPGHEVAFINLPDGQDDDGAGDALADGACPFAPCGGTILPAPCGSLAAASAVYAFEFATFRSLPPHPHPVLRPSAPPTGPPLLA